MLFRQPVVAVVAATLLSACGGSNGGSSAISGLTPMTGLTPPIGSQIPIGAGAGAKSTLKASAVLPLTGAPQFLRTASHSKRSNHQAAYYTLASIRRTLGYTIAKVEVDGTVYPGYAGSVAITNKQTFPVTGNSATVALTFSNVPVGNNEWTDFDFYAVAADGSEFYLGSYAKIVSIAAAASSTITLDAPSTQRAQALDALIGYGILDANDLATTTNLEAQIAAQLASAGIVADPTTQLLSQSSVQAYVKAEAPVYAHTLTITAPAAATEVSIVADDTNVAQANLALWPLYVFAESYYVPSTLPGVPYAYGTPPPHPVGRPAPRDWSLVSHTLYTCAGQRSAGKLI